MGRVICKRDFFLLSLFLLIQNSILGNHLEKPLPQSRELIDIAQNYLSLTSDYELWSFSYYRNETVIFDLDTYIGYVFFIKGGIDLSNLKKDAISVEILKNTNYNRYYHTTDILKSRIQYYERELRTLEYVEEFTLSGGDFAREIKVKNCQFNGACILAISTWLSSANRSAQEKSLNETVRRLFPNILFPESFDVMGYTFVPEFQSEKKKESLFIMSINSYATLPENINEKSLGDNEKYYLTSPRHILSFSLSFPGTRFRQKYTWLDDLYSYEAETLKLLPEPSTEIDDTYYYLYLQRTSIIGESRENKDIASK